MEGCGWPLVGQICPFWQPQKTRLQTNCLLPLPCRWLCTQRRPSTSNRTRPQPRHTTRTGRPPSGAAIAAVGTHCATIWYMPPPGPACIITGHIPQAWPCIVPIGGAPACTVTPACTVPGTPACAGDIACCSTPPCPGCNCLGEVASMGAAGAPRPWRCGSTAAVLGLARTTVVAVGGLAEAGLASSGCPSSESGERARLLASPFSEVIVATGRTMTAERMALPESSAESVLGETALTGSDPVERPIGNWSLSVLLVHAFTGSDEAGAEPVGLAAAVFAGVVSEDGAAWYSSMRNDASVAHAFICSRVYLRTW